MAFVNGLGINIFCHIDLHETTDTDESEFRPALAARDGKEYEEDEIPDGFYLVGDSDMPNTAFQTAIIDEVRKVTHIAPPDSKGNIIGAPIEQKVSSTIQRKNLACVAASPNANTARQPRCILTARK